MPTVAHKKSFIESDLFREILAHTSNTIWILDAKLQKVFWFAQEEHRSFYRIPVGEEPMADFLERIGRGKNDFIEHVLSLEQKMIKEKQKHKFFDLHFDWVCTNGTFKIKNKIKVIREEGKKSFLVMGTWEHIVRFEPFQKEVLEPSDYKWLFHQLCDVANAIMWEVDFQSDQITWWGNSKQLLDYRIESTSSPFSLWEEILHPDDKERAVKAFLDVAERGETRYFDHYRILKRDGSYSYVVDNGVLEYTPEGKPKRALGSWIDITLERQREEALEDALVYHQQLNEELASREEEITSSEEELRQINEQLSANLETLSQYQAIMNHSQKLAKIASWQYELATQEVAWSDEMLEIYDIGPEALRIAANPDFFGQFYDEEDAKQLHEAFLNLINDPSSKFDVVVKTKTNKKWLRIIAFCILNAGKVEKIMGLTYDMTSFKQAEERVKSSEAKFSSAFLFSPNMMTIFREEDSLIVDANEKIAAVLGYKREEVIGQHAYTLQLFVDDADRQLFYQEYIANKHIQFETRWYRKDRSIVDLRISSTRIEIEGKYHILSIIQDISLRKAAEEKFRQAFNMSPDLMLIFREQDFRLVEANSKLFEISGFSREEVMGRTTHEFELWADQNERWQTLQLYHQNGFVHKEALFRAKNKDFYGTISMQRIELAGENHALAVVRDVSERKNAEALILQNEANLQAVINNTDLQVWSVDAENRFILFNEPYYRFTKETFGREVFVGKTMLEGASPELMPIKEKWDALFQKAIKGESFKFQQISAGRYFMISIRPIKNRDLITGVTGFAEDITERIQAEQKIIQSEARLDAVLNNSNFLIWSLDRDYRITAMNKEFKDTILRVRGYNYEIGDNILKYDNEAPENTYQKRWKELYDRAFLGERVEQETSGYSRLYFTSLNPIYEQDNIIGVAVFSQDITHRKQEEKEFQNKTIELAEANKKIGELKLTALRSFMNPHFIFNALNSIQYFIATNDRLNAINYLSTFSKLIRGILTHSVDNKISLADELELIRHYVNLESVRFENKFDFESIVDPGIDLEYVEIPSLLIQPFVENAILHGLCNKKGRGKLILRVHQQEGRVMFEVEDDGIGRKAAKALRELNFPKHKSVGLMLTEERLRLINEHENVSFKILDLEDENGHPTGTKVQIWVKV